MVETFAPLESELENHRLQATPHLQTTPLCTLPLVVTIYERGGAARRFGALRARCAPKTLALI